jgi:hypothetical protein
MYARINPFSGQPELAGLETVFAVNPPTPTDASYSVPCLWIDSEHDAAWLLLRIAGGLAYWALLATCDPYPLGAESGDAVITESGNNIILN